MAGPRPPPLRDDDGRVHVGVAEHLEVGHRYDVYCRVVQQGALQGRAVPGAHPAVARYEAEPPAHAEAAERVDVKVGAQVGRCGYLEPVGQLKRRRERVAAQLHVRLRPAYALLPDVRGVSDYGRKARVVAGEYLGEHVLPVRPAAAPGRGGYAVGGDYVGRQVGEALAGRRGQQEQREARNLDRPGVDVDSVQALGGDPAHPRVVDRRVERVAVDRGGRSAAAVAAAVGAAVAVAGRLAVPRHLVVYLEEGLGRLDQERAGPARGIQDANGVEPAVKLVEIPGILGDKILRVGRRSGP